MYTSIYRRFGQIGGVILLTLICSYIFQITLFTLLFLYIICGAVGYVFVEKNRNPMWWSASTINRVKSADRSTEFIEDRENSSVLLNSSAESRRREHSSFSRSPIKITRRPRFHSPAEPLLSSSATLSQSLTSPMLPSSSTISPILVSAKRYTVCSPEEYSYVSPYDTSNQRYTAVGQRRYPTHQPQYSSLGHLPAVKWKGGNTTQSPLRSNSRNSPITVKIPSLDVVRSPSPLLQRLRNERDAMSDPLNRETILSALRASKKRTLVEQEEDSSSNTSSVFEKGSKRRRYDNSSSSSISTWATATPMESGRNSPIPNGGLQLSGMNTSLRSVCSAGSGTKRSRNAIDCSYSSTRRVKQKRIHDKGSESVKRKTMADQSVEDISASSPMETPRKFLLPDLKSPENGQASDTDAPRVKRIATSVTTEEITPKKKKVPTATLR